ncbi:MAG TPA: hypothetical protein VMW52_03850 [Phycisphaerae bacterium]|nr:hypothetical protein [Phycisphaerae bacterium]
MATEQEGTVVAEGEDPGAAKGPTLEELQKANASKDRVIAELQEGKALPKWARDAGFQSREQLNEALKSRTPGPQEKPAEKPVFDAKKYANADGVMDADGLARFHADLEAWINDTTNSALDARREGDLRAAEPVYIAHVAETAPDALKTDDPADTDILAHTIEGIATHMVGEGQFIDQKVAAEARERFAAYVLKLRDKEVARLAEAAREAADAAAPAHNPGGGAGQPKPPAPDTSGLTPDQRLAQVRDKSREAFVRKHAG